VFSERRVPKDQLMEVQSLLIKLGFNPGPADGIIGPKTLEAVRKYQKSNGMEVDGKISEKLLEQLRKSY
jgi:peptidoglycan hydrolase-like protein with peptidoglycan-binding domain